MTEASAIVAITNELGLHAKPAMAFGATASAFMCEIRVTRLDTGETIDGKSLLGMLTLALTTGTEIRIAANGDDAQSAVDALTRLVKSRFGES